MFLNVPQHPVHYVFGVVTHAPSVYEAWVAESFEFKIKWLLAYLFFFLAVGASAQSIDLGIEMASIAFFSVVAMSFAPIIMTNGNKGWLLSISDGFSNSIILFHSLLLATVVINKLVSSISSYFGLWSLELAKALMALTLGLMVGFSLQMSCTLNNRIPWLIVPSISLIGSSIMFFYLTSV